MSDRIEAGIKHGHMHYWCSQECKDDDCTFGPCCEIPERIKRKVNFDKLSVMERLMRAEQTSRALDIAELAIAQLLSLGYELVKPPIGMKHHEQVRWVHEGHWKQG